MSFVNNYAENTLLLNAKSGIVNPIESKKYSMLLT